jgi:hypothetical protein
VKKRAAARPGEGDAIEEPAVAEEAAATEETDASMVEGDVAAPDDSAA